MNQLKIDLTNMPNPVYYSDEEAAAKALKIGNFYCGTNDVAKGPTSTTSFFSGINPPIGGYTIYLNKSGNKGPSIACPSNDANLIGMTNEIANASYTTVAQCFTFFAGQSDKFVMFNPINTIVTDGLVACIAAGTLPSYPRSGTTWYDLSAEDNDGTLENGPTFDSDGWFDFDGVDDFVQMASNITPSTGAFSMEFLYQISSTGGRGGMFERKPTSPYNGVTLGQGGSNNWAFSVNNGSQSVTYNATYPTTNTWYHDVGVYNGVNTVTFYRNGVLLGTTTGSTLGNLDTGGTRDNLRLMRRDSNSSELAGKVASSKVYTEQLSTAEVLQNYYQAAIVTDDLEFAVDAGNLVSYYNNVPYNATVNSLVGTITGTLTNGVVFSSGNGGYWDFDGVDDYIDIGNNCPTGNFSISSWVYKEGTGGWYAIFSAGTEIWFGLNNNGRILAHVGGPLFQVTGAVDGDVWTHCALTWDGTTGRIYVDGVEVVSSTSLDNPIATGYDIGRLSTSSQNYFDGKISQVQLYDGKSLTAAEVGQNYESTKNRFN